MAGEAFQPGVVEGDLFSGGHEPLVQRGQQRGDWQGVGAEGGGRLEEVTSLHFHHPCGSSMSGVGRLPG